MRAVREELGVRIAAGGMHHSPTELLRHLEGDALDIWQMDVVLAIGMHHARTLAKLAQLKHRLRVLRSPGGPTARRAAMRWERSHAASSPGMRRSVARRRRPPTTTNRPSGVCSGRASGVTARVCRRAAASGSISAPWLHPSPVRVEPRGAGTGPTSRTPP
ncbi:enolase C-terminal domain-like protein [Streptomyces sp. NBC_00080]|uniref:enolase C-terminal domain-like protein n=1 Tax=unclassified Streptomyces TaxID=2593676 RepID=UPI00386DCBFC